MQTISNSINIYNTHVIIYNYDNKKLIALKNKQICVSSIDMNLETWSGGYFVLYNNLSLFLLKKQYLPKLENLENTDNQEKHCNYHPTTLRQPLLTPCYVSFQMVPALHICDHFNKNGILMYILFQNLLNLVRLLVKKSSPIYQYQAITGHLH